jgi:very-short-patch-repair endonuclease
VEVEVEVAAPSSRVVYTPCRHVRMRSECVRRIAAGRGMSEAVRTSRVRRGVDEDRWRCVGCGYGWWLASDDALPGGGGRRPTCARCASREVEEERELLIREVTVELAREVALIRDRGGSCTSEEVDVEEGVPLRWRCRRGHDFARPFREVERGKWCRVCKVSMPEYVARRFLEDRDVTFDEQRRFPTLLNPRRQRGGRLRFDLFIPEIRLAVEMDGDQHERSTAYFRAGDPDAAHLDLMRRDEVKRAWYVVTGTSLLRVSYRAYLRCEVPGILERRILELAEAREREDETARIWDAFHERRVELIRELETRYG